MTEDRYLELAPLFALGALDGEDLAGFERHLQGCAACRAELRVFQAVGAQLPLALPQVPPSADLRDRVLAAARPRAPRWPLPLAAAAALVFGIALLVSRAELASARREAASARAEAAAAQAEAHRAAADLASVRRDLAEAASLRRLVIDPEARLATLTSPAAPRVPQGRVIWHPTRREAVLIATGLQPAPEGKAYEVWVIAGAAPVPAGVFDVDAQGRAVFRLPPVEATARVKTFAVTLEPAGGVPAPTGPIVLAGNVG